MGDDAGLTMVHRLRALTVELDLLAAEFARLHGFHATDLRALICLLDAERAGHVATPGWLGAQLGLNSASVTALIDRLERAGHVHRDRDATDRRRINLQVTAQATELGWSFFGPLIAHTVAVTDRFSDTETATIARFINEVLGAVAETRNAQRPHTKRTKSQEAARE
jgi:DNA-binding MarR family transcriptional regulator